ncbi:MAG: GNAT family N-acetyltransferase [Bacteroidetes bacterium]|nr:GNAT family N-acetyltransferase [Bacteroidota bacterium]MCK6609885.1 GNAT family N-acetyltransferase [Bacteroidia bacterium]
MLVLEKTTSSNPDFLNLVTLLDAHLRVLDGEEHSFFAQFNQVDSIPYVILGRIDGVAVACGAIKPYQEGVFEIKRMFVRPAFRGNGYAGIVVEALENWAKSLGANSCILETGHLQKEAIRAYEKASYFKIPNYGQYEGVESSVCFQKILE